MQSRVANIGDLILEDRNHHLHPMTNPVSFFKKGPDMVARAEGVYLYTSDGRKILDMGSGLANVNIGYGNVRLCEAAFDTMRQLSFSHGIHGRSNPWTAALSARLADITPEQYQYFFFASTGSEAVESAVKMALRYWRVRGKPQKRAFISRRGSYHGNTLFASGLTGIAGYHTPFGLPIGDLVHYADSTCWYREGNGRSKSQFGEDLVSALEKQIQEIGPENIAAFVGDPIPAAIIPPEGYWRGVRRLCDRYDILLIADEVVCSFGKTGRMFGFENFDYEPDLIVVAKGITSGYFPLSAVGIGAKIGELMQKTDEMFAHVFTNCGHPVGAAVALENIAVIQEQRLMDRVRDDIEPYFESRLKELLEFPCVGETQVFGVFGRIEIDLSGASHAENDAFFDRVVDIAWKKGVATKGSANTFCLPMIITREQIDEGIAVLKEAIAEAVDNRV